jgi:imidazolonepropionase-like amidohydrolase
MHISVTALSMTGGHSDGWLPSGAMSWWGVTYPGMPDPICDGVDGVAAKVREVVRAGADVIKISSTGGFLSPSDDPKLPHFSEQEVESIVATAADLGRWVVSHAHGAEGIKRAVRAGVRSIEHGTFLDPEAAELMVERGRGSCRPLRRVTPRRRSPRTPRFPSLFARSFADLGVRNSKPSGSRRMPA